MSDKMKKSTTVRRQAIRISELEQQLANLREVSAFLYTFAKVTSESNLSSEPSKVAADAILSVRVVKEFGKSLQEGEKDE